MKNTPTQTVRIALYEYTIIMTRHSRSVARGASSHGAGETYHSGGVGKLITPGAIRTHMDE